MATSLDSFIQDVRSDMDRDWLIPNQGSAMSFIISHPFRPARDVRRCGHKPNQEAGHAAIDGTGDLVRAHGQSGYRGHVSRTSKFQLKVFCPTQSHQKVCPNKNSSIFWVLVPIGGTKIRYCAALCSPRSTTASPGLSSKQNTEIGKPATCDTFPISDVQYCIALLVSRSDLPQDISPRTKFPYATRGFEGHFFLQYGD